jgi:hypothetical protein
MSSQQHAQFLYIEWLDRPLLLEDCQCLVFNILTLNLDLGPFVATRGHLYCNEQAIAGHVNPVSHMLATTVTFAFASTKWQATVFGSVALSSCTFLISIAVSIGHHAQLE